MEQYTKKSKKAALFFGIVVVLSVVVWCIINFFFNGGALGVRDSYGTDIVYRDEGRTFPLGTIVTYDLSHTKRDSYSIKTDATGSFPIAYEANIDQGNASILIKDGNLIVREYDVKEKEHFDVELSPDHSYTIEIYIEKGKGRINLMWMEMAEDVISN